MLAIKIEIVLGIWGHEKYTAAARVNRPVQVDYGIYLGSLSSEQHTTGKTPGN